MAGKSLIIVESPAKTRTIKNYLGDSFSVLASMGHVRDLPDSDLGVDIENNFAPNYVALKDRSDVMKKIRDAVKDADTVYLATDPDREGEAIAWHLQEALKLKNAKRIEFNEITKSAITYALANPRDIDLPRVNAQQARRILDRLVGYQLSPLLWKKVRRGLSAGRVQSVAVKLVCDREREINAFIPEEYWTIIANVCKHQKQEDSFKAKLIEKNNVKYKPTNEAQAKETTEFLEKAEYVVVSVKNSTQRRQPQPPFITSSLQQEASRSHGYNAKRIMRIAQDLYEGIDLGKEGHAGLITYMRTDSTNVSEEAKEKAAEFIERTYGIEYLPENARKIKKVQGAQEAHEAIRPTDPARTPESIAHLLNPDQLKIYKLIWRRFMASQMANARIDVMIVDLQAGEYLLRANGQRVAFPGFLKLSPDRQEGELLPDVKIGEIVDLLNLKTDQNFTQPPSRYTEATLIKALESRGIGRPSTYAAILSTIIDRKYTTLEEKKFHPTGLGLVVNEQLETHFKDIVDPDFTARMEGQLDEVENGKEDWVKVLRDFHTGFNAELLLAADNMVRLKVPEEALEKLCPECGKHLVVREGKFGKFIACSGFPECKYSGDEKDIIKSTDGSETSTDNITEGEPEIEVKCDKCGSLMVKRNSRRGPFLGCSNYPECKNIMNLDGQVKPEKAPTQYTTIKCEKCGRPMALRNSKRGQFLGCSGFPRCRSLTKLPEDGVIIMEQSEVDTMLAKAKEAAAKKTVKKVPSETVKKTVKKTTAPKTKTTAAKSKAKPTKQE
ncbi:MAG: type I DNA topoisomerase [bacterium]